jgi:ribosomal protein S12 methylthiotransferase accessory factor
MQKNKNSHPAGPMACLINPLTGIVKWTIEVPLERSDPEVFVVAAKTSDTSVFGCPTTAEINGSGAGLTIQKAYGAAIGECVERYASCFSNPEEWLYGSYNHLKDLGYDLIHPEKWALFHPQQWHQIVDEPFSQATPVAWVKAESMTQKREVWVPACLVYMSSAKQFVQNDCKKIGPSVSTGTACANTRSEALLKGMYEVIERDAFIIMWRNRLSCPRVEINPENSLYAVFRKVFDRPGLKYNLFYTTLDLGVPSFFGYLQDLRRDPPAIVVGGAAHSDPQTAILKTLLELLQGLKWIDYLDKKLINNEPGFSNIRSFDDRVHLYAFSDMQECFTFLQNSKKTIPLSDIKSIDKGNTHSNLRHCLSIFKESNLEVIGIDLTTVDAYTCGLHVVKVLVPGCEQIEGDHRYRFLGGERWRKVPVQLGLKSEETTLETLNPYPHPYP